MNSVKNNSINQSITVAIPCLNEENSIGKLVRSIRMVCPEAKIIVFDNDSSDKTDIVAREAGAEVRYVFPRGKGRVIQEIFKTIKDNVVVILDGDGTYSPDDIYKIIYPIVYAQADMTIGNRFSDAKRGAFKKVNKIGNIILSHLFRVVTGCNSKDWLSGFRAFSPRFMDNVQLIWNNFETEVEMTVAGHLKGMRIKDIPVSYYPRDKGVSKLNPFKDGFLILLALFILIRDYKPTRFFISMGMIYSLFLSLLLFVLRSSVSLPVALLVIGNIILVTIFLGIGQILNTINTRFEQIVRYIDRRQTRGN